MVNMSFKAAISNTERSRTRLSSHRQFITLTTHISIVFVMSLAGTLATGYYFLRNKSGGQIRIGQLLQGEMLYPLIAIAMAITLGAGGIVMFTLRHRNVKEMPTLPNEPAASPVFSTPSILRLHRNAERLNTVERSLMVKMSHSEAIDLNTRAMLTEMQMCTKRLLGGLAELERESLDRKPKEHAGRERDLVAY